MIASAPAGSQEAHVFSTAELSTALRDSGATGLPLIDTLRMRSDGVEPSAFIARVARTVRMVPLTLGELQSLAKAFDALPFPDAQMRACLPLRGVDRRLRLAIADPFDTDLRAWLEGRLFEPFELCLGHRDDIRTCLAQQEDSMRAMDTVQWDTSAPAASVSEVDDTASLSLASIRRDDSAVVRLVASTMYDALKLRASDVHLESTATGLAIKYRLDGVLIKVTEVPGSAVAEQALSRLKVLADLDIGERRIPQDGRFRVGLQGQPIDLRVSIMPSIHGEDAVLRILDRRALAGDRETLALSNLGFDATTREHLQTLARAPYGMLLVTGPTGSGKTTTLYALLNEINTGQDKIITIEDPVEYQLQGVLQIPVNEKKGLTFSRGLRSILRHDPDRILVGEIRDPETAEIAVQAALTGHQVYTSVHANSAFDVIGRFTHMGVEPYTLASALHGIVAQRLVRLVCTHCAVADRPDPAALRAAGLDAAAVAGFRFRVGRGCTHCRGSGYRGRRAIAEILTVDDDMREGIAGRASPRQLRTLAQRQGTQPLRQAALDAVAQGHTTLHEANRVTHAA
jgi:general secretion pathway protein E